MTGPEAGLAAERTALAWRRTAIGAIANSVLLMHLAFTTAWLPVTALSLTAVALLIVVSVIGVRRSHILHSHRRGDWADGHRAITTIAVAVSMVVTLALALALTYAFTHA
ncbi:DUF202 domain-containing protein [Nocardia huaxiensis]|uniref:DUF202 domain-containing protein n=1 Tax=Nocardia huaxiensis TaxID=2755382 RepID=UPI001E2D921C|nr:DUF202 domain-containing protein [Nocardia huaxiensis]UFS96570.1 DUF202 domain-containing protein [Nocardia huaxiensis]